MSVKTQQGSTLLEALIALLILSFAVLGLIGLQANLIRLSSQAQYRLQASLLGKNIVGMMATDRTNLYCYSLDSDTAQACPTPAVQEKVQAWRGEVMATLPNALEPKIDIAVDRTATVTLAWKAPRDPATRNLVIVVQPSI
jgi:type IV pilus assembly protein PilV